MLTAVSSLMPCSHIEFYHW